MILALRRYVCDVKRPVGPHARDLSLIVLASSAIFRLDPIADAHSPAAPVAVVAFPLLVATPSVLGFDELFEHASLLLAVVICVWTNETWRVEGVEIEKNTSAPRRTINIVGPIAAVSFDAAWIEL